MSDSRKNSIVEFLDDGRLCIALVIDESKSKVLVIDERGKRRSFKANRIVVVHEREGQSSNFSEFVPSMKEEIELLVRDIDIELLWECLNSCEQELSISEIASQYFPEPSAMQLSAVTRKLLENRIYFKQRGMLFKPLTPDQVEERRKKEAREREEAKLRETFVNWAGDILDHNRPVDRIPENMEGHIGSLEYYLYGTQNKVLEGLVKSLDTDSSPYEIAFRLLVLLGKLEANSDLSLVKAGIKEHFSAEVLDEAEALEPFVSAKGRADFTEQYTFAIDDEGTLEIDDAFSVEIGDKTVKITVHIADVVCFVEKESLIDKEAQNRSTTLYLPDRKITMLPPVISCNIASLKVGEVRPAMSFIFDFDENFNLLSSKIVRATVKLDEHIDYVRADSLMEGGQSILGEKLKILSKIAHHLRTVRHIRGAVSVDRPELKLEVKDGNIDVKLLQNRLKSRIAVGEFMILVNSYSGSFAVDNKISAIFRGQSKPDIDIAALIPEEDAPFDPVKTDELMRHMKPAKLSLVAEPHFSMAVDAYIQLTSPLRRYSDLVMQRQFTAHLTGAELPYNNQELLSVLASVENTDKEMKVVEGERNRYWMLSYFAKNCICTDMKAIIVRSRTGGYVAELSDYAYRVFLRTEDRYEIGKQLNIRIDEVDADKNRLSFVVAD